MKVLIDGINYELDITTRTATVCKREDNQEYSGNIVIPNSVTYHGVSYDVTNICDKTFFCCKKMTAITIPDSIASIGKQAFSSWNLTSIIVK